MYLEAPLEKALSYLVKIRVEHEIYFIFLEFVVDNLTLEKYNNSKLKIEIFANALRACLAKG